MEASRIAADLGLGAGQVRAAAKLLEEGKTIPFIARYRKEATGGLDEVAISSIRDLVERYGELDRRRSSILNTLRERGVLTPSLEERIMAAETLSVLEDLYLPFRPKRRTRASVARERGLLPLADLIFEQGRIDPPAEAARFVDTDKGVASAEEALAGARDIIAEKASEDPQARSEVRRLISEEGVLRSRSSPTADGDGSKYRDYADWSEPLSRAPSHRVMAVLRGKKEGFLTLHAEPPAADALAILDRLFLRGKGPASEEVRLALQDGYKRLLAPAMEREALSSARQKAEERAIGVFAENLRHLLLEPPLGERTVLAVDPGFRTGCKVVVLDPLGSLAAKEVIYPHPPQKMVREAKDMIVSLCEEFGVEFIAVGNGTAGRQTEEFLRRLKITCDPPVVMVDEAGASVYSASKCARDEFPEEDATVRGAVSIGRRLQDPLAELVKIDPRSIGIGQYQHDVDEKALKRKLDEVVEICVNAVGVDLNTASRELLARVSGLGPRLAGSIVLYREKSGPFRTREELIKVPGLGPRAFEQAAGFLRIRGGDSPLDASAVHPESYRIVEAMARDLGVSIEELMEEPSLQERIDPERYVSETAGLPTLREILAELAKPGRDPRREFEIYSFAPGVAKIEDLRPGMNLPGVVTNVAGFGAFVDVGVHQDGLVHISELADRFVRDPAEVVRVHQKVKVTVLAVDLERKRISLSMRKRAEVEDGEARP
ncbi:Tex family protein [Candidatus Methanocrinis natronophilus]|uniref:Tex family protein n=1 Tax=Candidatus Methanocrinis natronophilus TaxID=3033396 RepID=A0ABT5XAF9_9EURY|nr:Tex family protein [Candidatus Methanocrinis natronophilus]MDF0591655.1 Tex family protein [Candidatus Methanocrinis natronophilus]